MAWTSKSKDISISSTTDHPSRITGLVGRPPGVTTVSFTPAEFFGAAARCCHLNIINPVLVTSESAMIRALVDHTLTTARTNLQLRIQPTILRIT